MYFSIVEERPNEELITAAKNGNLTKVRELNNFNPIAIFA